VISQHRELVMSQYRRELVMSQYRRELVMSQDRFCSSSVSLEVACGPSAAAAGERQRSVSTIVS
jgi:hypothetical protein